MEYVNALDKITWEDRDYGIDDVAYRENMNFHDRDAGYIDQFQDPQFIADQIIGINWEDMDNEYTDAAMGIMERYENLIEEGKHEAANESMGEFLDKLATIRDFAKVHNESRLAKKVEESTDYEDGYTTPDDSGGYEEGNLYLSSLYPVGGGGQAGGRPDISSAPKPSAIDSSLATEYGMKPLTPIKRKSSFFSPVDEDTDGDGDSLGYFGQYKSSSSSAKSSSTYPTSDMKSSSAYPASISIATDAQLNNAHIPIPHVPLTVPPPLPPMSGPTVIVRPLQVGPPRTFYYGGRAEVSVPEPSMVHLRMLHDAQARGERPLAAKHGHKTHLGDYVVIEKTAERLHLEVDARIPKKSLNRLVNLIVIHGKKIKGAIFNQLIDGTERSHGQISKMSKTKIRSILSNLSERTTFIVQSPIGAGLGALDSPFWTHWSVGHYLTNK